MQQRLDRLRRLARLWDAAIRVPGTRLEIGLDPIVGLVPGIGDAIGAIVASWVIVEAVRLDAPASVLLRMIANIAIDTLAGAVPVIGDLFDVAWKANLKNVALLERHLKDPRGLRRASLRLLLLWGVILLLLVAGGVALGWVVLRVLLRLV